MNTKIEKSESELTAIQFLRGVAAIIVVLRHCIENTNYHGYLALERLRDFGAFGVDLFFVISGFIMLHTSWDKFDKTNASIIFIVRRCIRILPLYWAITLSIILGLLLVPEFFGELKFDLTHALKSMLLVPSYNQAGQIFPLLIPGWTLIFEAYFYVIFSIFLFFPRNLFIIGVGILFFASALLGNFFLDVRGDPVLQTYTNPILIEFFFGCLIAHFYNSNLIFSKTLVYLFLAAAILLISGIIIFGGLNYHRFISFGIPAALLVFSLVFAEKFNFLNVRNVLMLHLGKISYSLYLVHVLVIAVVLKIVPGGNIFENLAILFIVSILSGLMCFHLIENPVNKYLKRLVSPFEKRLKSE